MFFPESNWLGVLKGPWSVRGHGMWTLETAAGQALLASPEDI